jgi:hypothetical protein
MVQHINSALWFLCFEAVICINLGVDLYIILFANNPVIGKVAQVCFRCFALGSVAETAHQSATEQGYAEPNEVSNRVRTHIMNKPAITTSDDAVIHKAFQRLNINPEEYTTIRTHDQTTLGPPMKFVDIQKSTRLANLRANRKVLMQLGNQKEKVALGLAKPNKNGYLQGWWSER